MAPSRQALIKQAHNLVVAGRYPQAEAICRRMLAKRSRDVEAQIILARIAVERGRYREAASLLESCLKIRPRDPKLQFLLGGVLHKEARYDEAMEVYDKLLRVKRRYLPAVTGMAGVHELRGDRAAALELLEPYIEKAQEDPNMAAVYGRLKTQAGDCERAIEVMERNIAKPAVSDVKRTLGYALGQALERVGEYDRAFEAYTLANGQERRPFNAEAARNRTDRIIAAFDAKRLSTLPRAGHATDLPVFVVGMPRSGTTLIERIIDAHPKAHGGGELDFLPAIVDDLQAQIGSTLPMPDCIGDLDQSDVDRLSMQYLDRLRTLAPDAERIVDKQLGNDVAMGVIELLFPQARVIHCLRTPADACFSCFASQLPAHFHPYANDLAAIAHVFLERERLMEHWRRTLTIPILTVQYEDIVEDQEAQSRRIIDFCGLEWDDASLHFYRKDTQSNTLSYDQVRRPVYKSSVGRAARYEKHLGPLREVLEGGSSGAGVLPKARPR